MLSAYHIVTALDKYWSVMVVPLRYLEPDHEAVIVWIALPDKQKQLLSLWGIEPESLITCVFKNKRNGMSAYKIRHTVIALGTTESSGILVKLLGSF